MKKRPLLALLIATPIALAILALASYIAYVQLNQQHRENLEDLEQFGYDMLPADYYETTEGQLGATQLPPTFGKEKLTPAQRVIKGLVSDKEQLIAEKDALKDEIASLEQKIAELEKYKKLNEHFAPESINDELLRVETEIKSMLVRTPDAERFSNLQIEVMSAAATQEYKNYISRNRLILTPEERSEITATYLPALAFCIGDAVDVAANSVSEMRLIARYYRNGMDKTLLTGPLREDLEAVTTPCLQQTRQEMQNAYASRTP